MTEEERAEEAAVLREYMRHLPAIDGMNEPDDEEAE